MARRSTSALMRSRESTAKRPAPETTRRSPGVATASKVDRIAAERALLAVEVGAVGARRRQQQRARRVARDPDAVLALRRARRRQRFGDPHRLAGRIAKQDRLQQRAGGRAEQRHGLVDRVAQAGAAEARRVDRGAQLIAVLEHELAGVGPGGVLAIGDRGEQVARAQRRSEPARSVGSCRRGAGGIGSWPARLRSRPAAGAR